MQCTFAVQKLVRATRGRGNTALLAIRGYEGLLYRLPVDPLEYIAIDEALRGREAVTPFSPHDQLAQVMRATAISVRSVTIKDKYAGGYLAVLDADSRDRCGSLVLRAGTAVALALMTGAELRILPNIVDHLDASRRRGTVPFEEMVPASRLVF